MTTAIWSCAFVFSGTVREGWWTTLSIAACLVGVTRVVGTWTLRRGLAAFLGFGIQRRDLMGSREGVYALKGRQWESRMGKREEDNKRK